MPASPIAPQCARRAVLSACILSALPALAIGGGFAAATPAFAPKRPVGATIPVTSCDDSGAGTLRDVLALAQPGDTIDLSGLACPNGEIVLTSNPIGTVVQDLEIHGPGRDRLTISGNDAHQVLITFTGITISDLTIAHGTSPSGFGGCLFIGGDLTLVRSTVTGCSAGDGINADALGGAAEVTSNLYMRDSTIANSRETLILPACRSAT